MNKNFQFKSFQKKRKRFINPHFPNTKRNLRNVILWQLGYFNDAHTIIPVPDGFSYPNPKESIMANLPKATWMGHSTFFLEIEGVRFLTDPVWSERCSPVNFAGPKRRHAPPMQISNLPAIDFVLISHDHYDHLDKKTVLALHRHSPHITWIVPEGLRKRLERWSILKVVELRWWEKKEIHLFPLAPVNIKVTSVPSQHFSGRRGIDLNKTLWSGFVVEALRNRKNIKRFYFVGDTGYNPFDFKHIGAHFGEIDLSLIPIGTYLPRKFMNPVHVEPKYSVEIHKEVRSKLSIGMHWKTFRLSNEPMDQPPYDLYLAMKESNLDPLAFRVLEPGQIINW